MAKKETQVSKQMARDMLDGIIKALVKNGYDANPHIEFFGKFCDEQAGEVIQYAKEVS